MASKARQFLLLLAVFLAAGLSLSLPNLLVIGGIMGARKTIAYASLVVVLATSLGMTYGIVTA
jgi:uncharacterized membrane protein YraQ (UPF0718 family)